MYGLHDPDKLKKQPGPKVILATWAPVYMYGLIRIAVFLYQLTNRGAWKPSRSRGLLQGTALRTDKKENPKYPRKVGSPNHHEQSWTKSISKPCKCLMQQDTDWPAH